MTTLDSNSGFATPTYVALVKVPNLLCLSFLICNMMIEIGPAS